jgi:deazaflavin-dependent oxidoreductase (nitroreductase family)
MATKSARNARRKFKFERRVGRAVMSPVVAALDKIGVRSQLVIELETTGAKSGQPRRVPLTGRADDKGLWVISQHGRRAGWAHNITAEPKVRVRVNNQWRTGTATFEPDDDVRARARSFGGDSKTTSRGAGSSERLVAGTHRRPATPSHGGVELANRRRPLRWRRTDQGRSSWHGLGRRPSPAGRGSRSPQWRARRR